MELKTGYKQTEIGVIPSDWEVERFVEITKIITCGLAATPKYVDETVGKPFLSAQNVQNGKVVYEKYKFIPTELYDQITKHNPPQKGDLLYTRVGAGIGEAGVVEDDFKFGIYVSLTLIRVDEKKLYNYFLLHLLNSPKFRFLAKNGQFAGGGVQNLNVQIVRDFLIPLPKFAEQTAIATALSDTDQYITHLEKLIAKKRNIKQGAMQELLKPKEGWVVKKLGEVGKFSKGQGIKKDDAQSGEIPCVRYGELYTRHNDYVKGFHSFISREISLTAKRLKIGDILFAGSGETKEEIGKCAAFINDFEAFAGGDIVILSPVNQSSLFLGFLLNTPSVQKQKASRGQGDAVVHISSSQLEKIEVALPSLETQNQIASILSDMDSEITTLETKLSKAKSIKQGMMQQLLTGKIRLV